MTNTTCPTCGGKGHLAFYPLEDALHGPGCKECPTCHGTGTNPSEPGKRKPSGYIRAVSKTMNLEEAQQLLNLIKGVPSGDKDMNVTINSPDSLEQELEKLLLEYDQGGYPPPIIPKFVALIRRRESAAVEAFAERVKRAQQLKN